MAKLYVKIVCIFFNYLYIPLEETVLFGIKLRQGNKNFNKINTVSLNLEIKILFDLSLHKLIKLNF